MMNLPNDSPGDSLTNLMHIKENVFRRVRDDGELGEEIIFKMDKTGRVTRLIRNSQYYIGHQD